MNALLCKLIDRWTIRLAAWRMPHTDGLNLHLEEAAELLQSPDFFCDFAQTPKDFKIEEGRFQFTSSITTPWEINNTVHGQWVPCGENWRDKPTLIFLHGWNDEIGYRLRFPVLAQRLHELQINAVAMELPYHFHRRPREATAIRNFFSPDMLRTVEATRQAVADTRALRSWLMAQGCPKVGLWGVSMGAWMSGLVSCYDEKIDSAVLITPPARTDRALQDLAFCKSIRRSLQGQMPDTTKLNLIEHRPKVPHENILLVEAEHDCFVPKETVEELWRAWGQPEIWRLPHGHITILGSSDVMERAAQWVAKRLKATPHNSTDKFQASNTHKA